MKTLQVNEKIDFFGEPIFVGIDVHKKQWNVSIMSTLREHKTFVQPAKAEALGHYLRSHFPGASYKSVYEAGFSGFWIHEALAKEGIDNIVVNPADVPTNDKEKKQKSDRIDSRKLCRSLREQALAGIYVPCRYQQEDRGLVRLRKRLSGDITRYKNRIKGLLNYYGIEPPVEYSAHWPGRFITWLQELKLSQPSGTLSLHLLVEELLSIQKAKKQLERHLVLLSKQKYAAQVGLLKSIPGIGLVGALTFITELGDIKRFKHFDNLCS